MKPETKIRRQTVTIGIPAFNEEINIKFLLKSLLSQKVISASINQIIIISDGSKDKTVEVALSVKDNRITVINRKKRLGLYATQNEILKHSKGDILVLLDADVIPEGEYFIEKIIRPILKDKKVGIVGADTVNAKPYNFVEKMLASSHEFKKYVYRKLNYGNNVYLCHGRARAFSKQFYSVLNWPKNCPEDAYSYFFCLKMGFQFVYEPQAKVLFRAPSVLNEHAKKSKRFFLGKRKLEEHFPKNYLKKQYAIPSSSIIMALFIFLIRDPVSIFTYLFFVIYVKFLYRYDLKNYSMWKTAITSKLVVLNE